MKLRINKSAINFQLDSIYNNQLSQNHSSYILIPPPEDVRKRQVCSLFYNENSICWFLKIVYIIYTYLRDEEDYNNYYLGQTTPIERLIVRRHKLTTNAFFVNLMV